MTVQKVLQPAYARIVRPATSFAELFASTMASKGLTDSEAARVLGVSQPTVTRWRQGRHVPGDDHAATLAEFCGVPEKAIHKVLSMYAAAPRRGTGEGTFGDLIRTLEHDRNLDPSEAWRRYGVDKSTYYRWRASEASPRLHEVPTLATKLGVPEERIVMAIYRTVVRRVRG